MIDLILDRFPVRLDLSDGSPASIRMPESADESAFAEFHRAIPAQEQFLPPGQAQDGSLFKLWTSDDSYEEYFPLLAFVDGRVVAMALLQQRLGGWKRHIGLVSFLTHPDFHGMGLIEGLLTEIVEVAKHYGMTRLESALNGERDTAIQALSTFGFNELVRLPDYVQDMEAEYHDYVLMGISLIPDYENLGAGD